MLLLWLMLRLRLRLRSPALVIEPLARLLRSLAIWWKTVANMQQCKLPRPTDRLRKTELDKGAAKSG